MKVLFRVDASLEIGTGHVMRCLTLADALRIRGAVCRFVCREHPGNLLELIQDRGFEAHMLPLEIRELSTADNEGFAHEHWLGSSWTEDVEQTLDVINGNSVDWLIVDHYSLDERWEGKLRSACANLMVIDDLADRSHDCDLLLDQNLGREPGDYVGLVPDSASILTGPRYALLRPEFASLREISLRRRAIPHLNRLLISMGGVDQKNVTARVLKALKQCNLPEDCKIIVVMGPHAPWLEEVRTLSAELPWHTEVLQNVQNMAQLMADSDLAIGAAGVTAWERCSLGLPSLLIILAENQRNGAKALEQNGGVLLLGDLESFENNLPCKFEALLDGDNFSLMQHACSALVDGEGIRRIVNFLVGFHD